MFSSVNVRDIKRAVVPADGLAHQIGGKAMSGAGYTSVCEADSTEYVIQGWDARVFRIYSHTSNGHRDKIRLQIHYQGKYCPWLHSRILEVYIITLVRDFQTFVAEFFLFAFRSESESFAVPECQDAIITVIELHEKLSACQFEAQWRTINGHPRNDLVFTGEYAAHDANLSNSVDGAVAEAAMMTGMERNGDVVRLASYAPLFNRIGHSQWTPDMIWFDAEHVVLTPSYYVQKMFSDFSGTQALDLNGQEKTLRENKLYVSAVKKSSGSQEKIIKIANGSEENQVLVLTDTQGKTLSGNAEIARLVASSGTAKKVVPTDAVASSGGTKAVSPELMSNRQVCEKRAPESVIYTVAKESFDGEITIPAKSFVVVKLL